MKTKEQQSEQAVKKYMAKNGMHLPGPGTLYEHGWGDGYDQGHKAASEWLPIESAPKDGTEIDIWVESSKLGSWQRHCNVMWEDDSGYWYDRGCYKFHDHEVTHWMPLPAPPTTKKSEDNKDAIKKIY